MVTMMPARSAAMRGDGGKRLAEQIVAAVNVRNDVSQAHTAVAVPAKMRDGTPIGSSVQSSAASNSCAELRSGAEEHEPDHAQDQHRKPGRDREKGKHRRPGLGLAGFGRGFDDLIVPSALPWGPRFLGVAAMPALRRHLSKATHDHADVPGLEPCRSGRGRRCRAPADRPGTVNAVGEIPRPGLFETRLSRWYPRALGLLRFRSIPWPPAPTGKAFCAFRS